MSLEGRKFLDQLYHEAKELRRLREIMETKRLSPLPGSILPDPNKVQTSRRLDPMGDALASAADLQETISARVIELNKHRRTALDIITTIDDSTLRTLLILRYLKITEDCKRPSWEAIASDLGYTRRHTLRLHGEALEAFNDRFVAYAPGAGMLIGPERPRA